MKSDIQIRNSADVCYIDIEGTIGVPEQWQFASPDDRVATYEKFRDAVARIAALDAPQVVVNIRSTGGDVNDALLIYDALAALDAEVTTRCYGYVASAATLIAQAASEGRREISAGALYLVHAAACAAEGNAAELEARAELLRKTDERLAALYARRSGRPQEEFAKRMAENNGNGRWLSPEETVAAAKSAARPTKRPMPPTRGSSRRGYNGGRFPKNRREDLPPNSCSAFGSSQKHKKKGMKSILTFTLGKFRSFDSAFPARSRFTTFCHQKVAPKVSAERKTRGPADGLRLKRYADKLAPAFSTVHPPPVLLPAFSQCGTIVRFAQQ